MPHLLGRSASLSSIGSGSASPRSPLRKLHALKPLLLGGTRGSKPPSKPDLGDRRESRPESGSQSSRDLSRPGATASSQGSSQHRGHRHPDSHDFRHDSETPRRRSPERRSSGDRPAVEGQARGHHQEHFPQRNRSPPRCERRSRSPQPAAALCPPSPSPTQTMF